uniref:Uncharacterized protein n=1 Tax=Monopterus albus TaxID=43700 RepID=A0A3Q3QAK1_MONAL
MLYFVKDPGATISFFQSLLNKNGKLVIILVSGNGLGKLWHTYKNQLCNKELSEYLTIGDIKRFLDSKGVSYQSYKLLSQLDVRNKTHCLKTFPLGHKSAIAFVAVINHQVPAVLSIVVGPRTTSYVELIKSQSLWFVFYSIAAHISLMMITPVGFVLKIFVLTYWKNEAHK